MRTGVYPGTFDPVTLGHLEIIQRASRLVDHLYICVAHNDEKKPLFDVQQRLNWVQDSIKNLDSFIKMEAIIFDGLLVEIAKKLKANMIIRGIRAADDFDFEAKLAFANNQLSSSIETIFLAAQDYPFVSSTIVRSIIINRGDISAFVPETVLQSI